MIDSRVFQSRKEKEVFLKEIIKKLSISETEKEIYVISLEILDDPDFSIFFDRITSQLIVPNSKINTIAPLTSTLLYKYAI